jgi:hypothetical protein
MWMGWAPWAAPGRVGPAIVSERSQREVSGGLLDRVGWLDAYVRGDGR